MDKHRSHPDRLHEDHIEQQMLQCLRIIEQTPAQLDDGRFPTKTPDPAHRFDQSVRFGNRCLYHANRPI
jgi:hypothetical protein